MGGGQKLSKIEQANMVAESVIRLIGILYKIFIFIQMSCLGYGELVRIKKYVDFVVQNNRRMKINRIGSTQDPACLE